MDVPLTIIVGIDGSPASQQALAWAIAEGRLRKAVVRAVYAWDYPPAIVDDLGEVQRAAERRLAEAVAELDDGGAVEQQALQGRAAEVLVEASRGAELLVVGSRGHGGFTSALLGSVSQACTHHADCPVVVIRDRDGTPGRTRDWHPDEVIARETAQNAKSWDVLARLGVREGTELALEFLFDTGGLAGDRELAAFLRSETGYEVTIEPGGVTGHTPPMPVSPTALDEWVTKMVLAGHEHGGCAFDGWTATLSAGRRKLPSPTGSR
jgi:nucleotide-binding universal stress UspA family protein